MKPIHKDKLAQLAEDSLAIQAFSAVVNERIEKERPEIKDEDNALIGEKYRAYETAKKMLKKVLSDIEDYRREKIEIKIKNRGK